MNPGSRRFKKILYTLIKINAFFREAGAEFLYGVYFYELFCFTADFSGKGNNPFANSVGSFAARPGGESAGQRAQFETGLYYFRARYLDTRTGRWIGCDPLGPELANPGREGYSVLEGTNWYGYCSNNPVRYVDPTGLTEVSLYIRVDGFTTTNNGYYVSSYKIHYSENSKSTRIQYNKEHGEIDTDPNMVRIVSPLEESNAWTDKIPVDLIILVKPLDADIDVEETADDLETIEETFETSMTLEDFIEYINETYFSPSPETETPQSEDPEIPVPDSSKGDNPTQEGENQ